METNIQQPATDGRHEATQMSPLTEIQLRMARERPRDVKTAVEKAIKELELFPEFAEKAYYSIPYKDNKAGRTVFVEGLSIRASMAMLRSWGNCISASQVGDERDDRVICEGLFFDYETGFLARRTVEVMRHYRTRDGKLVRRDANQMHLAIQATLSKAARNAALEGMPTAFRELYFSEAKRIVALPKKGAKTVSIQERIGEGKHKLKEKYVATDAELDAIVTAAVAESDGDWSYEKELTLFVGIWNALKDGADPDGVFLRDKPQRSAGVSMPKGTDEGETGEENIL